MSIQKNLLKLETKVRLCHVTSLSGCGFVDTTISKLRSQIKELDNKVEERAKV